VVAEGYTYYPFVHKRKSFEHEKEIRVIHSVFHKPHEESPFEYGSNIKVNSDRLIKNIYVQPNAPRWIT
jgi:hypothetical protein